MRPNPAGSQALDPGLVMNHVPFDANHVPSDRDLRRVLMPLQTRTLIAVLGPLVWLAPALQAQETPMLGFTSESADAQRQLEALFDEQMNRDNLMPHVDGIVARILTGCADHRRFRLGAGSARRGKPQGYPRGTQPTR